MKAFHNDAIDAIKVLKSHGHVAFLAGGCVRDLMLGIKPNDFDVTTSATPEQVQTAFTYTVPVGISFGVVKIIYGENRELDVATFRTDGKYTDNRRPDSVTFSSSAEEDVKRRDFTINGLMMDEAGSILDFVGGQEDLKARLIRAVGNATERFEEDALRMMRAVRFAVKLGFDIEPDTWAAIQRLSGNIASISSERITDELTKMMSYGKCDQAFWMMQKSGLWDACFPDSIGVGDMWDAMFALAHVREKEPFILPLALLLCDAWHTSKDCILKRLSLTNDQRRSLKTLLDRGPKLTDFLIKDVATKRKWMQWEDLSLVIRFIDCNRRLSKYQWIPAVDQTLGSVCTEMQTIKDMGWPCPLVTGDDLIEMGFIAGPVFSLLLERVRDEQLNGNLTEKDKVKAYLIATFPAAPRKLADGSIHDKMSRHMMVTLCKKCTSRMTFTIEFDTQGHPKWATVEDGQNLRGVCEGNFYFDCNLCSTKVRRTSFERMADV